MLTITVYLIDNIFKKLCKIIQKIIQKLFTNKDIHDIIK
jgi:hypothetical protein